MIGKAEKAPASDISIANAIHLEKMFILHAKSYATGQRSFATIYTNAVLRAKRRLANNTCHE